MRRSFGMTGHPHAVEENLSSGRIAKRQMCRSNGYRVARRDGEQSAHGLSGLLAPPKPSQATCRQSVAGQIGRTVAQRAAGPFGSPLLPPGHEMGEAEHSRKIKY